MNGCALLFGPCFAIFIASCYSLLMRFIFRLAVIPYSVALYSDTRADPGSCV